MVPWCRSIILSAIDKPRPFPLVLVVTIGKNTVCFICSGISGPLFEMEMITAVGYFFSYYGSDTCSGFTSIQGSLVSDSFKA